MEEAIRPIPKITCSHLDAVFERVSNRMNTQVKRAVIQPADTSLGKRWPMLPLSMCTQHTRHTIADMHPMRAAIPTALNALLPRLVYQSADHAADERLAK
jgi:hypothetical protein